MGITENPENTRRGAPLDAIASGAQNPSGDTSVANFRAALIQTCTGRDVDQNLTQIGRLIEQAATAGASYIQTPEVTALMTADRNELFERTAPERGNPALTFFADLAQSLSVWLHIGSISIQVGDIQGSDIQTQAEKPAIGKPDARKLANRSFLFAPDGQIKARYDKIHMFDVDISKGDSYWESKRYEPGNKAVIASLPWGELGMTICYDMRFPGLYRALAHAGAHFIAVPSAFTIPTGKAHWHALLRARAIETQCYILAAAQSGKHQSGRQTYGHSLIVSPWGEVLADAESLHNTVIYADIRLDDLNEARRRVPSLTHDRAFTIQRASQQQTAK